MILIGKFIVKSWDFLCRHKLKGGLGFRNLESFNQSLLAKQGWILLEYPDSLAARVLKGLYFPHTHFLDAAAKQGASLIWRSIVWGRQLLVKGLRWRVGNGSTISVFQDKWIPPPSSFKILVPTSLPGSMKVAELCSVSGGWNSSFIRSHFSPLDAAAILSLPSPSFSSPDRLI
ncbi:hypothetical protein ACOSQ3_011143 [Xanthoceras sorbifolium]